MKIILPEITPGEYQHYWKETKGETDCGVFAQAFSGHAYSVCRAPRLQTEDKWNVDGKAIAALPELLQSLDSAVRLLLHTYPNALDLENPDPQITFMLDSLRKAGATIED